MNPYTIGWAVLGAAFALFEGLALANPGSGDTLSEHVWASFAAFPLLRIPVALGLGWVAWHFLKPRK